MSTFADRRSIAVVTACMRKDGSPAFALTEVAVIQEEADNGVQYYLVEAELLQRGYDEPFVHFTEDEAPAFLHAAVRQFLGQPFGAPEPSIQTISEDRVCPV